MIRFVPFVISVRWYMSKHYDICNMAIHAQLVRYQKHVHTLPKTPLVHTCTHERTCTRTIAHIILTSFEEIYRACFLVIRESCVRIEDDSFTVLFFFLKLCRWVLLVIEGTMRFCFRPTPVGWIFQWRQVMGRFGHIYRNTTLMVSLNDNFLISSFRKDRFKWPLFFLTVYSSVTVMFYSH